MNCPKTDKEIIRGEDIMESEILTGRKINEAKNNTTDEAVEEILKAAQEQINRDMGEKSAHKKEETFWDKSKAFHDITAVY